MTVTTLPAGETLAEAQLFMSSAIYSGLQAGHALVRVKPWLVRHPDVDLTDLEGQIDALAEIIQTMQQSVLDVRAERSDRR